MASTSQTAARITIAAALVLLCNMSACGSGDSGPTDRPVPNGAFLATVVVETHTAHNGGSLSAPFPTMLKFSMVLQGVGLARKILASDAVSSSIAAINDSPANLIQSRQPLVLGTPEGAGCRGVGPVTYQRLELWVTASGQVEGLARGEATVVEGDTGQTYSFAGRVVATPDNVAPTLHLNPSPTALGPWIMSAQNPTQLHPFDEVTVKASEPLQPFERVFLRAGDGRETDFVITPDAGAGNRSFHLPWPGLLPSQTYTLVFSPPAADLAGNPSRNSVTFSTSAVPLYDSDDFETDRTRSLDGLALTSDKMAGAPTPAPISGQASLFLPPATAPQLRRFAMRLPVSSSQQHVSLKVRRVSPNDGVFQPQIALFTDKAKFSLHAWAPTQTPTVEGPFTLGPVEDIVLPLPDGTNDEVMMAITVFPLSGCGPTPPTGGLLIDDIKLE